MHYYYCNTGEAVPEMIITHYNYYTLYAVNFKELKRSHYHNAVSK